MKAVKWGDKVKGSRILVAKSLEALKLFNKITFLEKNLEVLGANLEVSGANLEVSEAKRDLFNPPNIKIFYVEFWIF